MGFMKNKKAVNVIVASVLLIFLVLLIGAIILSFSTNFIKKQRLQSGLALYYEAELIMVSELATGGGGGGDIQLGVRRKDNEGEVEGVKFTFENNQGSSYTKEIYDNPPNNPGIVQIYDFTLEEVGVSDIGDIKKISLRLLYNNKKSTSIVDELELG